VLIKIAHTGLKFQKSAKNKGFFGKGRIIWQILGKITRM